MSFSIFLRHKLQLLTTYDLFKKAFFASSLPLKTNLNLLDLGCGDGSAFESFGLKGDSYNIHLVDPYSIYHYSPSSLPIIKSDAISYMSTVEDNYYDFILIQDVLEHLTHNDCIDVLSACNQKLRSGGVIFARVPNGNSPFALRNQNNDYTHKAFLGFLSLKRYFEYTSFTHVETYPCYEVLPGLSGFIHTLVVKLIFQPIISFVLKPYIGWSGEFFWTPNLCIAKK